MVQVDGPVALSRVVGAREGGERVRVEGCPLGAEGGGRGEVDGHGGVVVGIMKGEWRFRFWTLEETLVTHSNLGQYIST